LRSIHRIDADDELAIHALPLRVVDYGAHRDIVREGDRPSQCCIIFDGMTGWYKTTGDGRRQILSFQIAGDIPDLHGLHLAVMDSTLLTFGPCKLGFVDHEAMRALCDRRPRIASAFWRSTLIDGAIFREWVANVGGRKAFERVAHLLCEQVARRRAVDLMASDFSCSLPLTQVDISNASGLSTVHVNRALQHLRKLRLIRFERYVLTVLDWDGLQDVGDFDLGYLNLTGEKIPGTPLA
jgi:CRP-like cAMP-binding protein